MKKVDKRSVTMVLGMVAAGYPGLVEVDDTMLTFWLEILRGLEEPVVIEATKDLCSAPGKYPPSAGDVRHRATELSMGLETPPSACEAWMHVLELLRGKDILLSEDEEKSLTVIGGISSVRRSSNIGYDRTHFFRAYDEFTKQRIMESRSHNSTRVIAALNAPVVPALPELTAPPPDPEPETEAVRDASIRGMLDKITGYRAEFSDTDTSTSTSTSTDIHESNVQDQVFEYIEERERVIGKRGECREGREEREKEKGFPSEKCHKS